MGMYERIKELCDKKGIAVTSLESELGFGRGSIGKLKKGGSTSAKRLEMIARYFDVSVDYLSGVGISQHQKEYYYNQETADMAQQIFENRDMRILFDAARNSRPEDLKMAADLLERLKGTNPDA